MKAIIYNIFTCTLLLLACVLPTACSDWNEPEPVDVNINSPKDQNPELWASYMQVLNTYKQSKHYIAYTRFDNSPEKPVMKGVSFVHCPTHWTLLPYAIQAISAIMTVKTFFYYMKRVPG